jgi:16S rRNA (adenine1518-N6/adenine1519-N6)-dimethyltransferase
VESVLVSMARRPPPVKVDQGALWRTIEVSFQQRRKTMRGAMIRLGLDTALAEEALRQCGIRVSQRPEELGLAEFACLAEGWRALASGVAP